jgi:OTU domain-containing protein 5
VIADGYERIVNQVQPGSSTIAAINRKNPQWDELDIIFEEQVWNDLGLVIKLVGEDGACLFRSVSDQIYGDEEYHGMVRQQTCDYMAKNGDYFQNYLTSGENILDYINRKRHPRSLGNHLEIQAMSELYNRPFEVYEYSIAPVKCLSRAQNVNRIPIRISYHRKCHFNSLYDPNASPKLGLGLGLSKTFRTPDCLQEELEKRKENIMKLETSMMTDKILETDVELSEKAMLRQAMQESVMLSKNDHKRGFDDGGRLSPKRSKLEKNGQTSENHRDNPCCSKSLGKVEGANLNKNDGEVINTKKSGKGTTFQPLPKSSKVQSSVDDEDDVIQHILELSKHEF